MNRVFVGGTGRSGTTILSKWIGAHASMVRFPHEARFHIDADGVLSLYRTLTSDYSMDQSRISYARFVTMTKKHLCDRSISPYQGIDLRHTVGQTYTRAVDKLLDSLTIGKFEGWDYHTNRKGLRFLQRSVFRSLAILNRISRGRVGFVRKSLRPTEEMYVVRRLSPDDANFLFGSFIRDVFDAFAESNQVAGWCEDTPANALHTGFLGRLIPDAKHIQIVRNPYGTVASFLRQVWAPSDLDLCVDLLENIYRAWISELEGLEEGIRQNVLLIRLEDLHERTMQDHVREFLSLEGGVEPGLPKIREVSLRDEKEKLSGAQRRIIESRLSFVGEYFGY